MSFPGLNFSVHKEGFRFITIGLSLSFVFLFINAFIAWTFIILSAFCAFFFRNPKRGVPSDPNLIVSPSDGTVVAVNFEEPAPELGIGEEKRYKVSVFLSIFNVHLNRIPVSGKIKNIIYQPGSFLNASLDKASVFNEKNTVVMELEADPEKTIAFSQIAGLIARRIVCDVHEGQEVNKGEIFGLIRFGSRCDIWLPVNSVPQVFVGQTMIGGESVLADLSSIQQFPREGTII